LEPVELINMKLAGNLLVPGDAVPVCTWSEFLIIT
jgi:hypothetical protein